MAAGSKKNKTKPGYLIVIYLLIVAILALIVYATPLLTGAFDEEMTIEYGNLKVSDEITCYIVRDEVVYFAGENGAAGYYFDEEELARAGSQVVTVDTAGIGPGADYSSYNKKVRSILGGDTLLDEDSTDIISLETSLREELNETEDPLRKQMLNNRIKEVSMLADMQDAAPLENLGDNTDNSSINVAEIGITGSYTVNDPGFVSYQLDGYESEFNPDTMTLLDREKVENTSYKYESVCTGNATKNEPLFKVVDNKYWYAVSWISPGDLGKYAEGRHITLNIPSGHISGTVHQIVDKGDEIMIILEFTEFFDGICNMRKLTTEIITSDYSGLVINNEFIASEDGQPGVYVIDVTGETHFTPIKVRTSDGVNSLVSANVYYDDEGKQVKTVSAYDEIKKP